MSWPRFDYYQFGSETEIHYKETELNTIICLLYIQSASDTLYNCIIGVCTAQSGYSFFLHYVYMYTEMIGFWKIMLYITLGRPINNALFQMGCSPTKLQSSGTGRYELQLEISSRKRFHLYHV